MVECEIYIMVDENGDYTVDIGKDEVIERWENDIGSFGHQEIVCLKVLVPKPQVQTATVTLPADSEELTVTLS